MDVLGVGEERGTVYILTRASQLKHLLSISLEAIHIFKAKLPTSASVTVFVLNLNSNGRARMFFLELGQRIFLMECIICQF